MALAYQANLYKMKQAFRILELWVTRFFLRRSILEIALTVTKHTPIHVLDNYKEQD